MTRPDARSLGKAGLFKRLGDVFRRINADAGTSSTSASRTSARGRSRSASSAASWSSRAARGAARSTRRPSSGGSGAGSCASAEGEPFGHAHEALAEVLHARTGWRTDRSRRTSRVALLPARLHPTGRSSSSTSAAARAATPSSSIRDGKALLVDLQVVSEADGTLADLVAGVQERARRGPRGEDGPPLPARRASSRGAPSTSSASRPSLPTRSS